MRGRGGCGVVGGEEEAIMNWIKCEGTEKTDSLEAGVGCCSREENNKPCFNPHVDEKDKTNRNNRNSGVISGNI